MDERMKFVVRLKDGERMSDLCREFGISRKTGYKFLERYERFSAVGLHDMRRGPGPGRAPHRTPVEIVEHVVRVRAEHPTWGRRKIRAYLLMRQPELRLPASSTIGDLLSKRGLVESRKRRSRPVVSYSPMCHARAPNDVWCIDFKGQFRLGNKRYCYPLTITDACTRYLLCSEALESSAEEGARAALEDCFRKYGIPSAMRSDNGSPFASTGLGGLSRLSVWWLRLGIALERIEPASPEQNGRHERMHRTVKAETTRPPGQNMLQQQERLDRFQQIYNHERPHEALGQRPPAELYTPSERRFPESLPEPQYPLHDLALRIQRGGHLYIPGTGRKGGHTFISTSLAGELVGVREVDDECWTLSFLHLDLGFIDTRTRRFHPTPPEEAV